MCINTTRQYDSIANFLGFISKLHKKWKDYLKTKMIREAPLLQDNINICSRISSNERSFLLQIEESIKEFLALKYMPRTSHFLNHQKTREYLIFSSWFAERHLCSIANEQIHPWPSSMHQTCIDAGTSQAKLNPATH